MTDLDLDGLPEMLADARAATAYSYEAGQYPDDLDPVVGAWIAGDGGLLNALDLSIRLVAALREARAEVERLRDGALAVLHDADLTYSLITETTDGPVPGPMRTDADAIARALGIDRITGEGVTASIADEYRAHRDRERERRIHWEQQTIRAEEQRDDWRRRYEALRDGVTGLCDTADRNHEEYLRGPILDRFIVPSNVTVSRVRAVVARVEES